jgi:D-3-phosphoglycerate dehydrogenase
LSVDSDGVLSLKTGTVPQRRPALAWKLPPGHDLMLEHDEPISGRPPTKRWRIGITDRTAPPFTYESRGFQDNAEFVYFDTDKEDELSPDDLRSLDAFLVWSPTLGERTIKYLDNCKIIVRYGVGYDRVDVGALNRAGIPFCNNPDYGATEVAETALSMILALQRRILLHDWRARSYDKQWQGNLIRPMKRVGETTVGLIGVGRIGGCACRRLKAFGFRVIGYDPYIPAGYEKVLEFERVHDLQDLVRQADVISFHCPLNDETRGLVDDAFIAEMKPHSILINTARGKIIADLGCVERALRSDHLFGVGFDVLPEEPPRDEPLIRAWRAGEDWLQGRLIINPHNAFYSDEAWNELRFKAAETAWLYLEKGVLRNSIVEHPIEERVR